MNIGVLGIPIEEEGPRVTDPEHLREIEAAGGKPDQITGLAARLGPYYGFPQADHFYVPYGATFGTTARDEHGQLIAHLAAWRPQA